MVYTASDAVLKLILPKLQPEQIDELRMHNRYLRDFIGKIRADLPCHPVESLVLNYKDVDGSVEIVYSVRNNRKVTRIEIPLDTLNDYLSHLRPHVVRFFNTYIPINNDSGWLKKIKYLSVHEFVRNKIPLQSLLDKLNCPSLNLVHVYGIHIDADELLTKMPCVIDFMVTPTKYSSEFFSKLADKTKCGPGMRCFLFQNTYHIPVELDHLMHFIENAKFEPNVGLSIYDIVVQIAFLNCFYTDFVHRLRETSERMAMQLTDFQDDSKGFGMEDSRHKIMIRVARFKQIQLDQFSIPFLL